MLHVLCRCTVKSQIPWTSCVVVFEQGWYCNYHGNSLEARWGVEHRTFSCNALRLTSPWSLWQVSWHPDLGFQTTMWGFSDLLGVSTCWKTSTLQITLSTKVHWHCWCVSVCVEWKCVADSAQTEGVGYHPQNLGLSCKTKYTLYDGRFQLLFGHHTETGWL